MGKLTKKIRKTKFNLCIQCPRKQLGCEKFLGQSCKYIGGKCDPDLEYNEFQKKEKFEKDVTPNETQTNK
jgi:hypothetical protein